MTNWLYIKASFKDLSDLVMPTGGSLYAFPCLSGVWELFLFFYICSLMMYFDSCFDIIISNFVEAATFSGWLCVALTLVSAGQPSQL